MALRFDNNIEAMKEEETFKGMQTREAVDEHAEYMEKLTVALGKLNDKFNRVTGEIRGEIQTEIDSLSKRIDKLSATKGEYKKDIDSLRSQIPDISGLTARLDELESELEQESVARRTGDSSNKQYSIMNAAEDAKYRISQMKWRYLTLAGFGLVAAALYTGLPECVSCPVEYASLS